MRFLMLTTEIPFPAIHGQRADVWRKIECFIKQADISLIYFYDIVDHDQHIAFQDICKQKEILALGLPIKRSLLHDATNIIRSIVFNVPYHVVIRTPISDDLKAVKSLISSTKPDAIWIEGLWMVEFYRKIFNKKIIQLPYFYRSHNIEFKYMYSQLTNSGNKLKRWFQTYSIKSYENKAINNAKLVFDCSVDDAKYWRSKGGRNIEVLTPLPESALIDEDKLLAIRTQPKQFDILFLGNLKTPNNVNGVFFLINEVLPLIQQEMPFVKVLIAGSSPLDSVVSLCRSNPNVELRANVPNSFELMCQSQVLVNPVATGSGVMVKMLDLIMTDQPIVSTTQGIYGLPETVRETISIADDANSFSRSILNYLLEKEHVNLPVRDQVRRLFSTKRIQEVVEKVKSELA
ncbi:glycosyltransferase family 4 protein [Methylophilus sp. TWE2]|uniref:glycosyltransferase family 4 protein n=1 Tax=Methylophilus sp. TWE2 TaxID=1662285 RepID=UPI00067094DC|nr:glycosyltransferase [Methylophilus sp. TWE2]AKR43385.1 hypothetical protein ACJ67_08060 [Methylophilus sp. TWE2]